MWNLCLVRVTLIDKHFLFKLCILRSKIFPFCRRIFTSGWLQNIHPCRVRSTSQTKWNHSHEARRSFFVEIREEKHHGNQKMGDKVRWHALTSLCSIMSSAWIWFWVSLGFSSNCVVMVKESEFSVFSEFKKYLLLSSLWYGLKDIFLWTPCNSCD